MLEFGKVQVLKRRFGLLSMISFTCILTCTWESMLCVFIQGFQNGGPAGLIIGFLWSWLGTMCIAASIGEMASMMPLSGGQYFWVYFIAPPKFRNFLSYVTGWINVLGWQAGTASQAFLAGGLIQGMLVLNYPNTYIFQKWHGTLLLYGVILVTLVINTYLASWLPKIEGLMFILHILGFFGILIPLTYLGPHGSVKDVFQTFANYGEWPNQPISFFVGISTSVYAFLGADSAAHLAEEIEGASTIVPWSMVGAIFVNGILGFAMLCAVLFCLGDIETVFTSPLTDAGFPFIQIFYTAVEARGGATIMTALVCSLMFFGTAACFTTASRMLWAFARDNGVPCSKTLAKVDPRTALPLWSITVSTIIPVCLALLNLGSTQAFNAVVSLTLAGMFISYLISIALMVNRRLRPEVEAKQLRWGPWRMGRWFGLVVNVIAMVYITVAVLFSFFPSTPKGINAESMNWSPVVFVAVVLFGVVYYFVRGNRFYKGPVVETNDEVEAAEGVKRIQA
ncbi:putative amino acid permease [Ascodesmis nigricans]|uniref:Putative amino acid permease n=1 Tax=Ascodesmis nigricans TaxID=341454 RepID=A0A4V3SI33_9PEZI|nr:putative amino acid permease [Ascodesmis nigricans]